jgi:hypothetical protein
VLLKFLFGDGVDELLDFLDAELLWLGLGLGFWNHNNRFRDNFWLWLLLRFRFWQIFNKKFGFRWKLSCWIELDINIKREFQFESGKVIILLLGIEDD